MCFTPALPYLITLATIFKVYEINEEYSPQQDGFLGKIDSIGKGDAEIIGIREGLFDQAAPLFGYLPSSRPPFLIWNVHG